MSSDPRLLEMAANWHANLEGENPDFDGFTKWLEADAAHARAYDEAVLLDGQISANAPQLLAQIPANDLEEGVMKWGGERFNNKRFITIAASIALVLSLSSVWITQSGHSSEYTTSGSAPQEIALGDDIALHLDRHSKLTADPEQKHHYSLEQGSAYFDIAHNPGRPVSVAAGDVTIADLGTKFTLSTSNAGVTVTVSEGKVNVTKGNLAPIILKQGERLDYVDGQPIVSKIAPEMAASWRKGQLIYENAPLFLVIRDINRYSGKTVALDGKLSNVRFSGVLNIGDGTNLAQNISQLMDIRAEETNNSVLLRPRS